MKPTDVVQVQQEPSGLHTMADRMLKEFDLQYGFGRMSCCVYDTAWISNVIKTVDGVPQYLFPGAFVAVLNAQLPDGSWDGHFETDEVTANQTIYTMREISAMLSDAILSTMAAMYSLLLHSRNPCQIKPSRLLHPPLDTRLLRAQESLRIMLSCWKIDNCNAVGFEVLCPALLDLLAMEGMHFDFPDRVALLALRDRKLKRLSFEKLHLQAPAALLHSFEAFHGIAGLDMEKFRPLLVGGSMMGSPAATASYLMRSRDWDDKAEAYLRMTVECGDGQGTGAVPSAWPSTNFEMLWVFSTLAEYHVFNAVDYSASCDPLLNMISLSRTQGKGLVGFAPAIEPDLDDSAKASILLSLAQQPGFSHDLINEFDNAACLKTYRGERDPSVSANCNALTCILMDTTDYPSKLAVIDKLIRFLDTTWCNTAGDVEDKWNLSMHYPRMVMSRSLTEYVLRWMSNDVLSKSTMLSTAVRLLSAAADKTLQAQAPNGSWGTLGPREETSYAILALACLLWLPVSASLRNRMVNAVASGRRYLQLCKHGATEFLWIEKISYTSDFIAQAYRESALHCSLRPAAQPKSESQVVEVEELFRREERRTVLASSTKAFEVHSSNTNVLAGMDTKVDRIRS